MINPIIENWIQRYQPKNRAQSEQALREILQELALVGLWRGKFFEHAAFYGGTALRILYGLDRFSEDLDFTLKAPKEGFSWQRYNQAVIDEIKSYGFEVDLIEKKKTRQTAIQSAFLKTNTFLSLIKVGTEPLSLKGLHPESVLRIKVEIDTDPIPGLSYETKLISDPVPYPISAVTEPDLFAGKLHAALYRAWKNRVKGRDWWDVIWFIRRKTPLNLDYVGKYMQEGGELEPGETLTMEKLKSIALRRIEMLDISSAQADVRPFLRDPSLVDFWSKEFLSQWIERL